MWFQSCPILSRGPQVGPRFPSCLASCQTHHGQRFQLEHFFEISMGGSRILGFFFEEFRNAILSRTDSVAAEFVVDVFLHLQETCCFACSMRCRRTLGFVEVRTWDCVKHGAILAVCMHMHGVLACVRVTSIEILAQRREDRRD